MMSKQKKGKLYLIPTPLSSEALDKSITPYLRQIISSTKYFFVENERTARRFISSLKLGVKIDDLVLERLDKDSKMEEIDTFLIETIQANDICVLSEAGCPGIADPGNVAVEIAHRSGIQVIPLVGPSSIFMALMASGFNGQSFVFHGYVPIARKQRIQAIKLMERDASGQTQIFMETPYRNDQLMKDLLHSCSESTRLCIAKSISAENESIKTLSIRDWKKRIPHLHKAPCIFLLYRN